MSVREDRSAPTQRRMHRSRAHVVRRRRLGALLAFGLLALALYIVSGSGAGRAPVRRAAGRAAAPPLAKLTPAPRARPHKPSGLAPATQEGRLPQTDVLPGAHGARLQAMAQALWEGIRSGLPAPAIPAFFPLAAYLQLKSIANPESDWRERLLRDYELDLAAAHRLLGSGAASAKLLEVRVPIEYAHWVQPGVCYNSIGYYEVPNSRLVYREQGEVRSLGIASMISWRGVWYVVHLGAVLQGAEGVVDEPASGAGVSAYSSTC